MLRTNRCGILRAGVLFATSVVVLACSAAGTAAVAARIIPRAAILDLPEYIGVLDYMGERTRHDRRPGHSYSYRAAGLGLDIDVFDYDPARLPNGAGSPLVASELTRMERALLEQGARLIRTGTVTLGAPGVAGGAGVTGTAGVRGVAGVPGAPGVAGARSALARPITAREAVFARRDADFRGTSYLWITARGGRLYEMHFNVREGFEEDGEVSRSESLAALGRSIADPSVPQALPPADQIDVAIQWSPATPPVERPLWAAYLYARAALVAAESGQVSLPLGEHTASFDEEVRGRLIAVYLYRQMRRDHPAFRSAYFAALSRVQAAGYLREYVWRYLKAPSWSQPDGLRLAAFDAWRAVHLRHHVPETYGRIDIVPLDRSSVRQVASR